VQGSGRCAALFELSDRSGDAQESVRRLRAAMAAADDGEACAAIALGSMGSAASAAVPELLDRTVAAAPSLRAAALAALADIAPGSPEVAEALRRGLRDGDWTVRAEAVAALGRNPQVPGARSLAIAAAGDSSLGVRTAAFQTLDRLVPSDTERVDVWRKIVAQRGHAGRFIAARRLAASGIRSQAAGKALLAALRDGQPFERAAAARALRSIPCTTAGCLRAISTAARDPGIQVRVEAVQALVPFGAEGAQTLGNVLRVERSSEVRITAMRALGEMGPSAAPAIPGLIALLTDPVDTYYAQQALAAIGATAVPALRELALRRASTEPQTDGRLAALTSLSYINTPEARAALDEYRRRTPAGK
jgi:HEAT repeat protein